MSAPSLEAKIRILIDTKDGQSQLDALSDAFIKHLQSVGKSPQALRHLRASGTDGFVRSEYVPMTVFILPPPTKLFNPALWAEIKTPQRVDTVAQSRLL